MNEDNAFLPHFIDEEIYVIDEASSIEETSERPEVKTENTEQVVKEPVKQIAEEPQHGYEAPSSSAKTSESSQKVEQVYKPSASLTYLGQNDKDVLLIVNSISTEENAFLEKVLGAVKLSMGDCALLKLSENSSPEHHQLIEEFQSEVVINFGGDGLSFLQSINKYKITFVADKKILQVDHLSTIMADVTKKKLLWESLQQLF